MSSTDITAYGTSAGQHGLEYQNKVQMTELNRNVNFWGIVNDINPGTEGWKHFSGEFLSSP